MKKAGFTLIELLVAITVLAVLLSIGVPSFNEVMRNNRTVAQANELMTALHLTRSESAKRGVPVTICAANSAQTACAGATTSDWSNGWLVFRDEGATPGALDTGEEILQTSRRVSSGLQLTTNNLGFLRFGPHGAPTNAAAIPNGTAAITFGLQHQGCTGTNRRVISVDRTGRPSLTKVTCS